ncbi:MULTISPECIES: o-succinylbenzoate synthase [Acidiplasma]|jgi:O-succinylbenzoate synthase|uniref:o-succinylbenzoate synthase n=3 Tax=Acidiplasma TaxID=507753 RepID=A0A0Q0VXR6_9ARCH|nr:MULTISPECIES: o-succinylbenzoate synthase [Acidiplasma]KJE49154.1 N-acylamino acid racemase [Acidiplasma sp. MBA-1]KPV46938.1 N-acylamino acid racemase [Acidiplasma aeolicum]KQB36513.1 o-succinylbenzoate synthase [Acidiplasma cupricumulans]WMT54906.1 MAG: o-succinylbenzoate synthase [Acidiplasma sp.]
MKLEYYLLDMPLIVPFKTSFGTDVNRKPLIFRLEHNGIVSYSESVTDQDPFYSYEDNDTALHVIKRYLAQNIKDVPDPEEFLTRSSNIKGHNMAKAALEMLLYDYRAREMGKPLHEFLGDSRGYANVGISIGMDDINKMIKRIDDALKLKYKRIKVKIMKGEELKIVSAIRDVYPDINLSVDANSDYTEKDFELLKKLDKFNLVYIEQPLYHDDLIYHARLAREISTPICLDESITSPEKAQKAFDIGACSVINIKPGRVSGLTNSLKIARIARENNGHVWIGGMLETGVGRSYNIAMASNKLIDYPGDTSPNSKYYIRDIVKNPYNMEDGIIKDYNGAGNGIEIDEELINKYAVERGVIF